MGKFYNGNKILGYNRPFNFIVGNRSAGKSYFWKRYVINRFLKTGEQFIYVRRYKDDIDGTIKGLFSDVSVEFPDHVIETGGGKITVDGDIAGTTIALSLAYKRKSSSFIDVKTIIYDEFLPENGRYLKNEWDTALNLYQTIARGGGRAIRDDVRFVFIANHVSLYNPYFRGLNVRIPDGAKYIKGKAYVIEIFTNEEVADEIKNSKVGSLLASGTYGAYAIGGKFLLDSDSFIKKMPAAVRLVIKIKYDGDVYGIYYGVQDGNYYISNKIIDVAAPTFVFSNQDHTLNYIYIDSWRESIILSKVREYYENGKVFFSNQGARGMFMDVMKYTQ